MAVWKISEDVFYVGVNDTTLDLFESQYRIPDGVTYNSYVIKDSKIAVMDTVDNRATDAWFDNLEEVFENREQIEISRYYEKLPKPDLIATQEYIEGKIYYRNPAKEKEKLQ